MSTDRGPTNLQDQITRVLVVVIVAVLVGGVVVAIAEGRGSPSTKAASIGSTLAPTTTSTTVSGATGGTGTTTTTTTAHGPTTTSAGSTTTTTRAPAQPPVTSLPTIAGPVTRQPTATAPGTYLYSVTSTGGQSAYTGTITEVVKTQSVSHGTTTQVVTDTEPQAPSSGPPGQGNSTQQVQWGPSGYLQVATTLEGDGQALHCTWSPSVTELPPGMAVGRRWSFASSCKVSVFAQPGTISISGNGRVTGDERVKVGTSTISVWVVSDTYTVTIKIPTFGVTVTLGNTATDRVATTLGLLVEEDATSTFTMAGQTTTSTTRQVLRSLTPS